MFLDPIRINYVLIDGQNGASRNISEVNTTFESIAYLLAPSGALVVIMG